MRYRGNKICLDEQKDERPENNASSNNVGRHRNKNQSQVWLSCMTSGSKVDRAYYSPKAAQQMQSTIWAHGQRMPPAMHIIGITEHMSVAHASTEKVIDSNYR